MQWANEEGEREGIVIDEATGSGGLGSKTEIDNGEVVFLTQEHWASYREQGGFDHGAMVLFYTDWCHHCKDVKPHYAQLSRVLKQDEATSEVAIVAMNCDTFGRDICRKKYRIRT